VDAFRPLSQGGDDRHRCTSVTVVSPWRLRPRIEDRQGFATVRRRAADFVLAGRYRALQSLGCKTTGSARLFTN
jgi:hypothetical protein